MDPLTRLHDLAVSDSGFVFDPLTGATWSVNATGRAILDGLKAGHGREAIAGLLRDQFDVAGADVERDVSDFVARLREQGLLPEDLP